MNAPSCWECGLPACGVQDLYGSSVAGGAECSASLCWGRLTGRASARRSDAYDDRIFALSALMSSVLICAPCRA